MHLPHRRGRRGREAAYRRLPLWALDLLAYLQTIPWRLRRQAAVHLRTLIDIIEEEAARDAEAERAEAGDA